MSDSVRQNARVTARHALADRHRDEYEQLYRVHQDALGVHDLTGQPRARARAKARSRALVDLEHFHPDEFEGIHHRIKHEHGLSHIHAPDEHLHDEEDVA